MLIRCAQIDVFSYATHFNAQDKLISKLISWCDQIAIEYNGVDGSCGKSVKKLSKSLKVIKAWKIRKTHWFKRIMFSNLWNQTSLYKNRLLVIIEAFNNWKHYLEPGSRLLSIISLLVHKYIKLELPSGLLSSGNFWYYFCIDYWQGWWSYWYSITFFF